MNITASKAASRLGLKGSMWLQLTPDRHVALLTQKSWAVKFLIPLTSIKRYGTERTIFSLEVGSVKPREQGVYFFQSPRAKEIFTVMNQ